MLLQNGADWNARNGDGRIPLDIAEVHAKPVLTGGTHRFIIIVDVFIALLSGEYRKEELLEAARNGNEELLMSLLTPLSVNCHANDGRKVWLFEYSGVRYYEISVLVYAAPFGSWIQPR